jgi:hypothetical protein
VELYVHADDVRNRLDITRIVPVAGNEGGRTARHTGSPGEIGSASNTKEEAR